MNSISSAYMMVGVLRRITELTQDDEGLTVQQACSLIADEIEVGLKANQAGKTMSITYEQMASGVFIGSDKH